MFPVWSQTNVEKNVKLYTSVQYGFREE